MTEISKVIDLFSKFFLTNNPYEQSVETAWHRLKDMRHPTGLAANMCHIILQTHTKICLY